LFQPVSFVVAEISIYGRIVTTMCRHENSLVPDNRRDSCRSQSLTLTRPLSTDLSRIMRVSYICSLIL